MEDEITKKAKLRNNEYYSKQEEFDFLYRRSKRNYIFKDLIKYIKKSNNIRLAYRNIKKNTGSKTSGLSGKNISFIANLKLVNYLHMIKSMIANYQPSKVRRVKIPKPNGKFRNLGIKESWDKILEQSIYQVLEPIVTAKFHNNSNGFISGRGCKRAISQFNNYITSKKLYYIVDIDLKSFFDNVNHGKLLKQLWTLGIRDKNLLSLISKMLKANIAGYGIQEKGTPQGGILSPLLANVVLNELDWWLDSKKNKGIYFVRYADDIRILCPTYLIARDMLDKTTKWLNSRLNLDVNEDKTKIINLKRNATNFLGCSIKVKMKGKRPTIRSHIAKDRIEKCEKHIKKQIRVIKKNQIRQRKCEKEVELYNSIVVGIHNYYKMNTCISEDLNHIDFVIKNYILRRLSNVLTFKNKITQSDFIQTNYGNGKEIPCIWNKPLIPIGRIQYEPLKIKKQSINYFDDESRKLIHRELKKVNIYVLDKVLNNPVLNQTVEFNDIVLSKFCGNLGKYSITNNPINDGTNLIVMKKNFKKDYSYDNMLLVENKTKYLLELKEVKDMAKISRLIKGVSKVQLEKINNIRKENSLSLVEK